MTSNTHQNSKPLEEIYEFLDNNCTNASNIAEAKFISSIEGASAAIASHRTIASARLHADYRVASSKLMIKAELAATYLLANADMQAAKLDTSMLTGPKEDLKDALIEISKETSLILIETAREAVDAINRGAETAMKCLRQAGEKATRDIQKLAKKLAEQTKKSAAFAAKKLKLYRDRVHTSEEALLDGKIFSEIIIVAAKQASDQIQKTLAGMLAHITAVTDQACLIVHEAALAAEQGVLEARERALTRLKEVHPFH